MRFRTVLLVGAVLAALLLGSLARTPPGHTASSLRDSADDEASEPTSHHAETFPYEVAARFNEGIVANIDAIDTALTTILAGNVAVLVLTIDRLKELAPSEAAWAVGLISVSTLACIVAYVLGFSFRAGKRDGLRPRVVIPDLIDQPAEALFAAVSNLVSAGEYNLTVRFIKKGLAVLAILVLLASAVVIALARAHGDMVY